MRSTRKKRKLPVHTTKINTQDAIEINTFLSCNLSNPEQNVRRRQNFITNKSGGGRVSNHPISLFDNLMEETRRERNRRIDSPPPGYYH